jgi:hypothetical protein
VQSESDVSFIPNQLAHGELGAIQSVESRAASAVLAANSFSDWALTSRFSQW